MDNDRLIYILKHIPIANEKGHCGKFTMKEVYNAFSEIIEKLSDKPVEPVKGEESMMETTETMNAQITFISNYGGLQLTKEQLEEWFKLKLGADDVLIKDLRRFEMERSDHD